MWCDLGCCSRTVVVIKLRRTSALILRSIEINRNQIYRELFEINRFDRCSHGPGLLVALAKPPPPVRGEPGSRRGVGTADRPAQSPARPAGLKAGWRGPAGPARAATSQAGSSGPAGRRFRPGRPGLRAMVGRLMHAGRQGRGWGGAGGGWSMGHGARHRPQEGGPRTTG